MDSPVATTRNHGHPRPKTDILVHFWAASLLHKLAFSEVHGCTSLNERRSKCAIYLQKFP